ncbi:HYR domain-containing protein [Autumnicola musiva]|uniref:HYR domain-containing protein n=1 Tax=Autumnicola musiva TaxID=3075589 RepID=A0ABU3D9L0_9FLAO|nr:HYR domain-containing protein [Zunongwangia sp. F117]MDT0678221.1 HYR domain-containing protein [Zunongwangia sp. F117]
MEKNYYCSLSAKFFMFLTILLLTLAGSANAQVSKDFTQRTSQYSPSKKVYNIHGDFTMIGNTNMTLQYYEEDENNSNSLMREVDEDGDPQTHNSSKAELNFSTENDANPECSNVIYAGLYWTGRTKNNFADAEKQSVKFKAPNGSYQSITANSSDIRFPGEDNIYVAYSEVTDLVRNGGTGDYWVADMALTEGNGGATGFYGGWGMVIIYENSRMDLRDVTVFDGYAYVEGNVVTNYELPVSGFNTAQNGDVNMKLGLMAGEGDRDISGDYFEIQKNSDNTWINLSHSGNSTNNFFNSSIVTEGNRDPLLVNNTGLDISMFNIPNPNNSVVGNNQSSTKFRYGSTRDTYVIFNLVMSVDAYAPDIEGLSTIEEINGQNVSAPYSGFPGDEITYKVEIKNKGNEPIENARLVIPVAYNVEYINSSAEKNIYFSPSPSPNNVTYDPSLGATGSVIWDIGTIPVPENTNTVLADISLSFRITEDCSILKSSSCGDGYNIMFNGTLSGKGAITGIEVSNKDLIQGYNDDGSCEGEPISSPLSVSIDATQYIQDNCGDTPEENVFIYCNRENPIPITDVNSAFPVGTRFYNEFPVTANSTEFNISNPFPNVSADYYAVLPGTQNCYIPFSIEVNNITSVPQTENIEYCINSEAQPLTAQPGNPAYQLFYYESEDAAPQESIIPGTSVAGEFTYYVAEGASNSCISPNKATLTVTVIANPEAVIVQQSTCEQPFGIIAVENPSADISYTLLNENGVATGYEYQDGQFNNVAPGTYRIQASNIDCKPVSPTLTINENEGAPATPVISVTQPDCELASGSISIENNEDNLNYVLLNQEGEATTYTYENGNFNDVAPGSYSIKVSNEDCEEVSEIFIIKEQPNAPATPVVAEIIQPTCEIATGSFSVNTAEGFAYSIDGNNFQNAATFADLAAGTYYVLARNEDGCISEATSVIIEEQPETPAQPEILSVTGTLCGQSNGELEIAVENGLTYTLANSEGEFTHNNGVFANLPSGTYQLTISNGVCQININITVPAEDDTTAPSFTTCASDQMEVAADNASCEASNIDLGIPAATDNCTAESELIFTNDAPDNFSIGETVVTWTVTDTAGNTATCTQVIKVIDTQAPVIEDMEDITVDTDAGICGAIVDYQTPTATDNCQIESVELTEGLAPGEEFPTGTTTVTYTATDNAGNTATTTFTVTVEDNEAPVIVCQESITVATEEGEAYAVVDFEDATATDKCSVTVEQTAGPVSGAQFPVGTTTITYTATDAAGNNAECSFTVTVEDNEAPELSCPSDISENAEAGICGAVVEFEMPQVLDNNENVSVEQTAGPASGEIFPVGTTTVSFTVTDEAGNIAECSFTVTISDDQAPVIEDMEDITVDTDAGICGAVVDYQTPTATDNCQIESVELIEGLDPGEEFPTGTTTVTYTATDNNGNTATTTFTITVEDNEAPVINCPSNITVSTEEGESFAVVNFEEATATDNCEVTVEQTAGPFSGSQFPVGTTTITYTATDAAGNNAECSFTVTVEEEPDTTPPAPEAPVVTIVDAICAEPTGTILVDIIEGLTYSIDGENYQTSGTFNQVAPGTYQVTAMDEFGQVSEATSVIINEPVAAVIETTTIDLCIEDSMFDLFDLLIGDYDPSGTWIDAENTGALDQGIIDPAQLEVGTYTFRYETEGLCPSTTEVIVSINDDCVVLPCSIGDIRESITKAVTPNNDRINDYFEIDIENECDFVYDVKIFNRWGAKVFEAKDYQNNWDGFATNSFTSSNQLPAGTYFYVLEIRNSGFEPIQGYIYLGTK